MATAETLAAAPSATATGFHAVIEIAGKAAPVPAPAETAPPQQALKPEAPTLPSVTASPAEILASLSGTGEGLQQVETSGEAEAISVAAVEGEPRRPRRRRPAGHAAAAEPVSLMQVETTAPPGEALGGATPAPLHPTRRRPRPQTAEPQEPLVQVETQSPQ
jgi:hypothetical protein